jgi:hypothetical protein
VRIDEAIRHLEDKIAEIRQDADGQITTLQRIVENLRSGRYPPEQGKEKAEK